MVDGEGKDKEKREEFYSEKMNWWKMKMHTCEIDDDNNWNNKNI